MVALSFLNAKGGVGKTSLCRAVAGTLAAQDKLVLVVDCDPDSGMTTDLGMQDLAEDDKGQAFATALQTQTTAPVTHTPIPGLDLVLSGPHLATVNSYTPEEIPAGLLAVRESIKPLLRDYEAVLIDTPPGTSNLRTMAAVASDFVVTPTRTDAASLNGVREVVKDFSTARELNPSLMFGGVVLFGVNVTAKKVNATARSTLEAMLPTPDVRVFAQTIRYNEAVANTCRDLGYSPPELLNLIPALSATDRANLPRNVATLAGDYNRLTLEMLNYLSDLFKERSVQFAG